MNAIPQIESFRLQTTIIGSLRFNDAPSTTTRPERIRSQTAHARGSTSSAVTLRRRQIILQRRVVESHRCSSTPAYVHLQPNHYRPRRQILNSLITECYKLNCKILMFFSNFVHINLISMILQHSI